MNVNAAIARLPAERQRTLALALLALAVLVALALLLGPILLMHKHYDDAIDSLTERLARYRTIAAAAPEYRKALEMMKAKNGRRFFLKNTAPNLAGAELSELVRAAIEGNGGRPTTSQYQPPQDEGRFRRIAVSTQFFATTPNLQKILGALESQPPYLVIENISIRPLNAFRGFKPAAGQEPEVSVQMEIAGYAFAEAEKAEEMSAQANDHTQRFRHALWWLVPLALIAVAIVLETQLGRGMNPQPPAETPIEPKPVVTALLPEYAIDGGVPRALTPCSARCSIRRGGRRRRSPPTRVRAGCSAASSRWPARSSSTATAPPT